MQELIQKMLRVEEEARKMVAEAETEARSAVVEAQRAAQQDSEKALEAARQQAREVLDKAVAEANEDKRRLLEQRRAEVAASVHVADEDIRKAADVVLRAVIG